MTILKTLAGGALLLSLFALAGCPHDWGRRGERGRTQDSDRGGHDRRHDDDRNRGGDERRDDRPH
jgi:hypothetical protein